MRLAILGAVLLLVGGIAMATGILPIGDAASVGERVWPILLFAVAITVVAELRWSRYVLLGLIAAPLTVVLATIGLALTA
jgi:hypothetical protein